MRTEPELAYLAGNNTLLHMVMAGSLFRPYPVNKHSWLDRGGNLLEQLHSGNSCKCQMNTVVVLD